MNKMKFNPAIPPKVLMFTALGALASLGGVANTQAGAIVVEPDGWERNSTSVGSVSGAGPYSYDYVVTNTSTECFVADGGNCEVYGGAPLIVDWELPYFEDSGINNIRSPEGWTASIETIGSANFNTGWGGVADWQNPSDPFYAGDDSPFTTATQVLHWYIEGCFGEQGFGENCRFYAIFPDSFGEGAGSLGGFGFDSPFAATDAPYQASWLELPVRTGDPAFPGGGLPGIPGSPNALGTPQQVPEPGTLPLVVLGAVSAFALGRRRRSGS